jgi:hypothetical protein
MYVYISERVQCSAGMKKAFFFFLFIYILLKIPSRRTINTSMVTCQCTVGEGALQRQFRFYIPFLGIARPQPQCAISTFMCAWAIYISPGSVHIFPPAEKADPSWKYIIRSQSHESGNWDWGPDIPFLGIFVSNFRHFVFAVCVFTLFIWIKTT